jgi:hypothetical protein
MLFVPENPAELLTHREAACALGETGRSDAAETLLLNPDAPRHHRFNGSFLYTWAELAAWADALFPAAAVDWDPPGWVPATAAAEVSEAA